MAWTPFLFYEHLSLSVSDGFGEGCHLTLDAFEFFAVAFDGADGFVEVNLELTHAGEA